MSSDSLRRVTQIGSVGRAWPRGQPEGTTSFAWTMASEARVPAINGQTYQRYSPGSRLCPRPANFQRAGTVNVGRFVSALNTKDEFRNSSTWYPDAPLLGTHANCRCSAAIRCVRGRAFLSVFAVLTGEGMLGSLISEPAPARRALSAGPALLGTYAKSVARTSATAAHITAASLHLRVAEPGAVDL